MRCAVSYEAVLYDSGQFIKNLTTPASAGAGRYGVDQRALCILFTPQHARSQRHQKLDHLSGHLLSKSIIICVVSASYPDLSEAAWLNTKPHQGARLRVLGRFPNEAQ